MAFEREDDAGSVQLARGDEREVAEVGADVGDDHPGPDRLAEEPHRETLDAAGAQATEVALMGRRAVHTEAARRSPRVVARHVRERAQPESLERDAGP